MRFVDRPRHRRDACSMAWRCRFLTARRIQHGAPDTLVDFHTAVDGSTSSCTPIASPMNVLQTMTLSVRVRSRSTQGVRNSQRNSPRSSVASDFSARSREMPRVCNNGGADGRGHAASSTDDRSVVVFFVVKLGSCSAVALTSSVQTMRTLMAVVLL